jgi:hypothetical protein
MVSDNVFEILKTIIVTDENGTKWWYANDNLHRVDGPAVEYSDGTKFWYKDGEIHRDDGPAVEFTNGDKMWYQNGVKHREDGPAVEYAHDGRPSFWYLHGVRQHDN